MGAPFYKSLYFRVLVGIAAGVVIGAVWPDVGARLDVVSTGFINLVKMTIGPLIFSTVVVGIAGVRRRLGSGISCVGRAVGEPADEVGGSSLVDVSLQLGIPKCALELMEQHLRDD